MFRKYFQSSTSEGFLLNFRTAITLYCAAAEVDSTSSAVSLSSFPNSQFIFVFCCGMCCFCSFSLKVVKRCNSCPRKSPVPQSSRARRQVHGFRVPITKESKKGCSTGRLIHRKSLIRQKLPSNLTRSILESSSHKTQKCSFLVRELFLFTQKLTNRIGGLAVQKI